MLGRMKRIDMTGKTFGRLTVTAYDSTSDSGRVNWRCRCECGNEAIVVGQNLRNGNTLSCGCLLHRRGLEHPNATHAHSGTGGRRTPEYRAWSNMMTRCYNAKNKSYADYGGRGITVCERWRESFVAFLADVGRKPSGTTLDRIDNDGNYEPGNVRWASYFVQARNRRDTRLSMESAAAVEAALRSGVPQRRLAREYKVARVSIRIIHRRMRGRHGSQ